MKGSKDGAVTQWLDQIQVMPTTISYKTYDLMFVIIVSFCELMQPDDKTEPQNT